MKHVVTLPGPGDWTLAYVNLNGDTFLLAANPNYPPRVIGRTATFELSVGELTENEKAEGDQ